MGRWSVPMLCLGAAARWALLAVPAQLGLGCASNPQRQPDDEPDLVLPVVIGGLGITMGVLGGVLLAQVSERDAKVEQLKAEEASKQDVQRAEIEVIQAQSFGAMGIICGGVLVALAVTFLAVEPPPAPPQAPPDPFEVPPDPFADPPAPRPAAPALQVQAGPTGLTLQF